MTSSEGRGEMHLIRQRFLEILDDAETIGMEVAAHMIFTKRTVDVNGESGTQIMRLSRNVENIQHDCADMADPPR